MNIIKIKALKNYKWKAEDSFEYIENELYEEREVRALEMIEHGYAEGVKKEQKNSAEEKQFKEDKKETKVISSEENKKAKKGI